MTAEEPVAGDPVKAVRGPGRPRDAGRDEAILAATLLILLERGYQTRSPSKASPPPPESGGRPSTAAGRRRPRWQWPPWCTRVGWPFPCATAARCGRS